MDDFLPFRRIGQHALASMIFYIKIRKGMKEEIPSPSTKRRMSRLNVRTKSLTHHVPLQEAIIASSVLWMSLRNSLTCLFLLSSEFIPAARLFAVFNSNSLIAKC